MLRALLAAVLRWLRRKPKQAPGTFAPMTIDDPQLDMLMRDFARRYHSAPPGTAVGLAVPPGMKLQVVATEALKRYPTMEACR